MTPRLFNAATRAADLVDAATTGVDVLVIGAGATGAGVALDAASRGLTVLLVDKGDLASGTSSKSSKLVHGGLRYLENYDFALVHEGVTERQTLMRLAPHLVRPMDFVYPVWPDTAKRRLIGLGMTTYDAFALASLGAQRSEVRRHQKLSAAEAVAIAPALEKSGMDYAYLYGDCGTDDARLVLAVVQEARRFGAMVVTHAEVTGLLTVAGRISGGSIKDHRSGETVEVQARHVVNATGVWVDDLQRLADPAHVGAVMPSKGVHVVVPRERLPLNAASVLLPSKLGDGRSMFAIPYGRQTILGTTDTEYEGSLDSLALEQADLDYVLAAGNKVFDRNLIEDDVLGAWAGVRPLLRDPNAANPSDMSRRHTLIEAENGLVTITGGKLTTYRRMAAEVVDVLASRDGLKARCRTAGILLGLTQSLDELTAGTVDRAEALGLSADVAASLVRQQGDASCDVLSLVEQDPSLGACLDASADHVLAEVVWAGRHEGALTLDDVLSRRTRISLKSRAAGLAVAPQAARLLAAEVGVADVEAFVVAEVQAYATAVRSERGVLGYTVQDLSTV